jgi:hypothetical protein
MRIGFLSLFTVLASISTLSQNVCSVSMLPAALQSSLVAYYPFCGNASDVSGNNYNGTVTNATLTTDRFGNTNNCYSFNGTNAHIETTTAFFNASWNQYTISFWFNTNNSGKSSQSQFNTIPHNSIGVGYNYSPNKVGLSLNSNPAVQTWNMLLGGTGPYNGFSASQWNHIVIVKNGNTWTQYINSVVDYTFTSSTAITNTVTNIIIGSILNPSGSVYQEFFSGKLDDYMIYNRALNASEVGMLYQIQNYLSGTSTGTVPCSVSGLPSILQSSLVAYYPFCGNASDASGNNYNGVVTNATLTTDRFGNANSSYNFNGANTHIETATPFFNASWNQYTISFWFNTNNSGKSSQCQFNTIPHNSIGVGYNYSPNKVGLSLNSNPAVQSWNMLLGGTGTFNGFSASQWNHIVIVKNGNVWTQYINSVVDYTFTSSTTITNTVTNINIGSILNPSGSVYQEFFSGKLDDYMIYNRALSSSEVAMLYQIPNNATGIVEDKKEFQMIIFPNPASDKLLISVVDPVGASSSKIKILDMLGKEVIPEKDIIRNGQFYESDISQLNEGIYFVSVTSKGSTKTQKFQKLK